MNTFFMMVFDNDAPFFQREISDKSGLWKQTIMRIQTWSTFSDNVEPAVCDRHCLMCSLLICKTKKAEKDSEWWSDHRVVQKPKFYRDKGKMWVYFIDNRRWNPTASFSITFFLHKEVHYCKFCDSFWSNMMSTLEPCNPWHWHREIFKSQVDTGQLRF